MAVKKSGLGRGIDAIFTDNSVEELSATSGAVKVKLIDIEPNRALSSYGSLPTSWN